MDQAAGMRVDQPFQDTQGSLAMPAGNLRGPASRLSRSTLLLGMGGLLLIVAALVAFSAFNNATEKSRRVELLLAKLESQAHEIDAIEWKGIYRGKTEAETNEQVRGLLDKMRESLERLTEVAPRDERIVALSGAFDAYEAAIGDELGFLSAGLVTAAVGVDESRVDPSFEEMIDHLRTSGAEYREEAQRRSRLAQIGSIMAILMALLAATVIALGVHDMRRQTVQRTAEDRVWLESERRFQALLQNSSDATLVLSAEGRITYASSASGRLLPAKPEALVGRPFIDFVHAADVAQVDGILEQLRASSRAQTTTFRVRSTEAQIRTVEATATNNLKEPHVGGLIVNLRDVSDRLKDQAAVRASEERYRMLFERHPQPMWVCERQSLRFLAVNDAALCNYGFSRTAFLEMTLADLQDEASLKPLREDLARISVGPLPVREAEHRRLEGAPIQVEIHAHAIEFDGRPAGLILANDISERKNVETQLRQSQKMDAVGRLAGGVAHDFNNILTAITGYGELLRKNIPADSPSQAYVREVLLAADRAGDLTRQLLAFTRQQVIAPKIIQAGEAVKTLEKMLRRLIGEDIELSVSSNSGRAAVKVDPGQLEQIIINLVVNARDAMPHGGKLHLETSNILVDETYARQHPGVAPGPYVMLAVSDTGAGMDEETRARAFEPFFTTKGPGKGTGLGLATVYAIVKRSAGFIYLYSEVNRGTTFKICLPRAIEAIEAETVDAPPPRAISGETILLVEDEEMVRTLLNDLLSQQGYHILTANNGDEALARAAEHAGRIDLVLTDVVMPGRGGRQTVEALKATRPDIRVLYMSGYTDDAVVHHGVLDRDVAFVQKPFSHDELLGKIHAVLEAPPAGRREAA